MEMPNINLTIYLFDYILASYCFRTMSGLHYTSFHNIFANFPELKMEPCYSVKAVFQSSHEAPRSSLRVLASN
jgi:hypothetical protein